MWRVFWVRLGAPLFMRVVWASGGGAFSVYGPGACCVRRFLRAVVGCFGYGWGGLAAWCVFCARLWVYPVCYEVDNSPLFNFNRIFSPFLPERVPKPLRRNLLFEGTMLMR